MQQPGNADAMVLFSNTPIRTPIRHLTKPWLVRRGQITARRGFRQSGAKGLKGDLVFLEPFQLRGITEVRG